VSPETASCVCGPQKAPPGGNVLGVPDAVSSAWQDEVRRSIAGDAEAVRFQAPEAPVPGVSDGPDDAELERRARRTDYLVLLLPASAALALVAFVLRHADLDAELTTLFVALVGLLGGHLLMRARRQRRAAEHEARRVRRELDLRARVADGEARRHRLVAFSQLAAQLAHEVRNPLGSIVLNAELLEEELHACIHASPEVKRLARAVSAEAERLSELTNEYLAFARLPRPDPVPQPLAPLVEEVVHFMRGEFDRAEIALVVEHAGTSQSLFDPRAIRQVLVNLVRNALEAVPAGGSVALRTGLEGRNALVDIVDSGAGVPEERREAVFDPFFSTKPRGTGLGLAVARKIAREHGGDLLLMPSVTGAWFRLLLPAVPSGTAATVTAA
jgi:signal transduction histidine kinase